LSAVDDTTRRDAAIERITSTASTDDGYRAQLVSLASSGRVERDRQLHTESRLHDLARRRAQLVALPARRKAAYEQALADLDG
jgi:hypothetical protein